MVSGDASLALPDDAFVPWLPSATLARSGEESLHRSFPDLQPFSGPAPSAHGTGKSISANLRKSVTVADDLVV